jgi:hypothetical protein
MRKWVAFLGYALLLSSILEGGTVHLINDSPYKLRSVVRANDGSFLGEMIISAQDSATWTDTFRGIPNTYAQQRSQTPYRVEWYCLDGSSFSICASVPTGNTVTSTNCDGAKECRGKIRPEGQGYIQPAPPMPMPNQQQQGQQQGGEQQQPIQPMPYPSPQQELENPRDQYPEDYQGP